MGRLRDIIEEGLERRGKFYGTYSGVVFRNDDPTGRGRISVSVPSVCKGILPVQAVPKGQWMGATYGSFIIPNVGDNVLIEFVNGDYHLPIWSFGPYIPSKGSQGEDVINFKKGVYRFRTPKGYQLLISEQPESNTSKENSYIEITTPKGNSFKLDEFNSNLEFLFQNEDMKTRSSINIDLGVPSLTMEIEEDGTVSRVEMNGQGQIKLIGNGGDSVELDGKGKTIINGGGENAVAIGALTDRLNKLQKELMSLINDYKVHTHPTAGTGSPSAPTVPYAGTISEFASSEYDDKTLTHPAHK